MSDDHERDGARDLEQLLGSPAVWATPPEDLTDEVLARIGDHHHEPRVPAPTRRWRRLAPLAVAAAVGAVAAVGVGALLEPAAPEPVRTPLAATALAPDASGSATVTSTPLGTRIGLDITSLPPAPTGTVYHGWVLDDGDAVSAGTFHMRGGDGLVWLWVGVDAEAFEDLVVTIEQVGDSPAAPDDEAVVIRGRLDT